MKEVTKLLINNFKIKELGYDFLGFSIQKDSILSFHHLILSKEYCKKKKLGTGYWYFNGVILVQDTSHEYLHLIQRYDDELFRYITSEMLDMKIKGYLDIKNLIAIGQILDYFEYQHIEEKNDKGYYIIKEKYLNRNRFNL
jgi:hypothetical protein